MNMPNRKTQQIANSINLLAQLPQGDALVHVLGDGSESSNIEALGHWVEDQDDLLEVEKPDHMIEQLIHRLHNKLDTFNSFLYE